MEMQNLLKSFESEGISMRMTNFNKKFLLGKFVVAVLAGSG
jgi:hypothetical protein